jgi:type I restriction enzyme S subunit
MSTTTPHTQTAYKDTSIGKIPADWEVKKLGELGEVVTGLTYSPSQVRDTGLLVLRSSNVQDRVLVFNDNVYVDERDLKYNPVKKGDILICVRNGSRALIGKNARVDDKAEGLAFGAFMAIFRSVLNDYLFHFFDTDLYYKQIYVNLGATINSINNNDLRDFKIPLPPLPEQKRIAEVLSTWDKAIQLTEQLIRQKEQRKKWLMQNLLTGKMRLKGFSGEWKEKKLEYFIKEYKQKPTPGNNHEVLTSAKSGLMKQTDYYGDNRITNRDNADYNVIPPNHLTYRSRSDDGLFTFNKNDLGITGLISGYYPVFTVKNGDLDFILMFMNYYRQKLTKYAIGTSQLVLAMNSLKEAKFHFPEFEEQTAIAEVLQTADKEIELLKAKAKQLKEQKKGLMQQLLAGRKRLNLNLQD